MQPSDPPLDLNDPDWRFNPALTGTDWQYLKQFHHALEEEKMEYCVRCREQWFNMGLGDDGVCARCTRVDMKRLLNEPFLYSSENHLDPGNQFDLPPLTQVEEMLIARVHVFIEIRQVRGVQYRYKGHIINFLRDTGRVYNTLPLLPQDLELVLLRPSSTSGNPLLSRQFARDFRVRQTVIRT